MNKLYTLLAASLLATTATAEENAPIFETSFNTAEDFAAWTVKDVNKDGTTWTFNAETTPHVYYQYHNTNTGDDWLISPEITPAADGTLMVHYLFKGSSFGESFEVYTGTGGVETMKKLEKTYTKVLDKNMSGYFLYEAKAGVPFRFAFRATSKPNTWRLSLSKVSVKAVQNPVDLRVSEIISPVTAEGLGQETVKVRLTNDGKVDAKNFKVGLSIDSVQVATETVQATLAPGQSMDYTFTAKADLSTPRKLYQLKAWTELAGDLDSQNDTTTVNIRHKAPATVPYTMGFEPNEYTDDIKIMNLNKDDGSWDINLDMSSWFRMARTGIGCLAYNYNKENAADDWAFLEPIQVEAGYYAFKFWYSGDDNHPEKFGLYYGDSASPEAMKNTVVEYAPFARGAYEESIHIIHFDKPQTVYFGFHAFSDKNHNWICIDDISISKVTNEDVDLSLTSFATPFDYVRQGNGKDVVFELRNVGIKDVDAHVTLNIDGAKKQEADVKVKAQEFKNCSFGGALEGLAQGKHSIEVIAKNDADVNVLNDTLRKDIVILGDAVALWDFEKAEVPAELKVRVADKGTVNPDAGEEFNEMGVGIFNLKAHPMLGEHVLAMTSWLEGTEVADRWLVLPKMKVTSEDSYFVWDANSFNPNFLESYEVQVAEGEDNEMKYSKVYSVTAESVNAKTHGVSLAKYVGKDVYVAIRLRSRIADCLILDNLGFYGGLTQGIGSTSVTSAPAIVLSGDALTLSGGAAQVTVVDASGRVLLNEYTQRVDIASLPTGVYVAKVVTDNGQSLSYKFVKK